MTGRRFRCLLLGAALTIGLVSPASADLEGGLAAYQAGDHVTALTLLEPEARLGNAQAQYLLGRMYALGEGDVLKNYSFAHTWLTLAANQGVVEALPVKMEISGKMSRRDIVSSMERQNDIVAAIQDGSAAAAIAEAQKQAEADAAFEQAQGEGQAEQAQEGQEVALAGQPAAAQVEPEADDGIADMDRRTLVREIQTELNRLGYDAGTPDGLYGPSTRSAIQDFQKKADLGTDGEATADLLRALRAAEG